MKSSLQVLNEGFLKKYLVEDVEEEETDEIDVGDLFTKGDETYKLLDVQIDEEGNVVVEAENQETEEPEEIEYISKDEAEENTEEEIATDDYKEDAEEADFEKSLEVEDDDKETKEVKDECLTEGEIGRTAGMALGSKFGMPELGGKIGSTIEDTAVDAFTVYRDTYGLSNREALLRLAKLAADKVSSRFPKTHSDLAFECINFKKLKECVRSLKEAQMSPEDEKDTAILRGIINKSIKRKNAKLTQEEKDILDKYGLYRDSYEGDVRKKLDDKPDYYGKTAPIVKHREYDRQKWSRDRSPIGFSKDKINLADRARKMDTRGGGYEANNVYANYDPSREYKKTGEDKYTTIKDKGLLDQERALQNSRMQGNYNGMKRSLNDRKIWQSNLNNVDSKYDKRIADLEKQIADAKKDKEDERSRYANYVNAEQRYINKLLKKEESLTEKYIKLNPRELPKELAGVIKSDLGVSLDPFSDFKISYEEPKKRFFIVTIISNKVQDIDLNDLKNMLKLNHYSVISVKRLGQNKLQINLGLSMNESLKEGWDSESFNSDVYNALAKVMNKWNQAGYEIDEEKLSYAIDWFNIHFWDSDDDLSSYESLSEELLDRHVSDFNSDVYNALAKVMHNWDKKGIQPSEEDMNNAFEWFSHHFYGSDDWY